MILDAHDPAVKHRLVRAMATEWRGEILKEGLEGKEGRTGRTGR
jgi:hypothetical protein